MTEEEAYVYIEKVFAAHRLKTHDAWTIGYRCTTICLDGDFTAEELQCFADGLRLAQNQCGDRLRI